MDDDKKAYGVAFMRHGFPQIAHASKEVILSAGTYSSPLLLMKSGIGPESILNAAEVWISLNYMRFTFRFIKLRLLKIPVKVHLEAVGKNLADHVSFSVSGFSVNDTSRFLEINSENIEEVIAAYHNGEGPLTTKGTSTWLAGQCLIVSTKATTDWPDILIGLRTPVSIDGAEQFVNLNCAVGRPKSKGTLTLDTEKYKAGIRDDVQLALIDSRVLTHPDDAEVLLEGKVLLWKDSVSIS